MAESEKICVSIVITNYNYANFLGVAISSALAQTHPNKEIIVVDDGSTDDSRRVIDSFGDRIRVIYKENGGQRSACNLGFRAASGDIVCFLDSDDAWREDALQEVVRAMRPGVAAVQFCVAIIDQHGRPLGSIYPPLPRNWTPQRIRDCVAKSGFYSFPPTSGNAYARWFLERVMPLPTDQVRNAMDGPLNTVAPLYGDVVVLQAPLGYYRIHGGNVGALVRVVPEKFSYYVNLDRERGRFLIEAAAAQGLAIDERIFDRALFHMQYRLASLRLRPDLHPMPQDRLFRLAGKLAYAALIAPDPPILRLLVALWGFAVATMPARLARALVAMRFISSARPAALDATLSALRVVRRTNARAVVAVAEPYEAEPVSALAQRPSQQEGRSRRLRAPVRT